MATNKVNSTLKQDNSHLLTTKTLRAFPFISSVDYSSLHGNHFMFLLRLTAYCYEKKDRCILRKDFLAEKMGKNVPTIERYTKALVEKGFISVNKIDSQINEYIIHIDGLAEAYEELEAQLLGGRR